MNISLNIVQAKSLSNFFSNMSVGWFIGAFITSKPELNVFRYVILGIFSLYLSLILLKGVLE